MTEYAQVRVSPIQEAFISRPIFRRRRLNSLVRRCGSGPGDPFANVILNERWDDMPAEAKQDLEYGHELVGI
jgi:hypothetical protein